MCGLQFDWTCERSQLEARLRLLYEKLLLSLRLFRSHNRSCMRPACHCCTCLCCCCCSLYPPWVMSRVQCALLLRSRLLMFEPWFCYWSVCLLIHVASSARCDFYSALPYGLAVRCRQAIGLAGFLFSFVWASLKDGLPRWPKG